MIPVVYSDTSSTITVKTVMEIVRQLESAGDARGGVHSILFRSVLNNREYELLERELGRHLSSISIGSVPKAMDRDLPSVVELCSEEAGRGVLCDFVLVVSGNLQILEGMHIAMRSRIRRYGYEIFMKDHMDDTEENRKKLVQFVAQEKDMVNGDFIENIGHVDD